MNWESVLVVGIPFIFGFLSAWKFMEVRFKKGDLNFLYGLVGYCLMCVGALIGEILAHGAFPFLYKGIGDNPAQIGGLLSALFLGTMLFPIMYIRFSLSLKQKNKMIDEGNSTLEK
jgi:hypothetical protein